MKKKTRLRDFGEKEIIRSIIKPLFNPQNKPGLVGDDCAVIDISGKKFLSVSTDRVPADLISFKLGLINYFELGYYLAILNISDIMSSGATFIGLLLNFAFKDDFYIEDFKNILKGVQKACNEYDGQVLGGDLSNAIEMNITATSIGLIGNSKTLYRSGAGINDHIYCSNYLGLTSTAFHYFLNAKPRGLSLSKSEEELLINQFKKPKAKQELSKKLARSNLRITCMDNTDGIGQSFLELSEINNFRYILKRELLPIHEISIKIAKFLDLDILEVILGSGADFQLVGTIDGNIETSDIKKRISNEIIIIGKTNPGNGLWIEEKTGYIDKFNVSGWDYFVPLLPSIGKTK